MKHSSLCTHGFKIFIKPTRRHIRRALLKKCCSQMDRFSQIYLLPSSFHTDYTTSAECAPILRPGVCCQHLAQGESDVGQTEGIAFSSRSSVYQSRHQQLAQPSCFGEDKKKRHMRATHTNYNSLISRTVIDFYETCFLV